MTNKKKINLVILPTQLFTKNLLKDANINDATVYLVEHPYYFTRFKFHKLKLAFLVASMLNYKSYLEANKIKVNYVKFYEYKDFIKSIKDSGKETIPAQNIIIDPIDIDVVNEFLSLKFKLLETPAFILTNEEINAVKYKRLSAFYNYSKRILAKNHDLDYLALKNLDKLNRKSMPAKELSTVKDIIPVYKNKFHGTAITYINLHFKNNFGKLDTDNLSELPLTHSDAKKHLQSFIKNSFPMFGPYQDFTSANHTKLYHSNSSHLVNIGLLTPLQVLKEIEACRDKISEQSFEAFIRQIVGWREYMRYIYVRNPNLVNENFWKNTKKLDWSKFYGEESTGIELIDNEIEKLKHLGWAHHIVRIMVFLNYFVLTEVDPKDISQWFHEVIALDSYDWVMVSNIWTMGYFTKEFTSKPYFISSNYIRKMSDYKNKDDFAKLDALYHKFLKRKSDFKFYRF